MAFQMTEGEWEKLSALTVCEVGTKRS